MTVSELKAKTQETEPFFFSRKTMKFFGDTMKNYGVRTFKKDGKTIYELYRKRPVKHGLNSSSYFDKNFNHIFLNN